MKPEVWEYTRQMLVDQGLLNESLDVTSAYTMTFLDHGAKAAPPLTARQKKLLGL